MEIVITRIFLGVLALMLSILSYFVKKRDKDIDSHSQKILELELELERLKQSNRTLEFESLKLRKEALKEIKTELLAFENRLLKKGIKL